MMATRPKRPCRHPGCSALTTDGHCDAHRADAYDRARGSAAGRGYGYAWQRLRAWFLAEHPLCERCKSKGIIRAADTVHHLDAVAAGHEVLASEDRLEALCRECHEIEEGRKKG